MISIVGAPLRQFGPASAGGSGPATPTLTVSDNGNGTATATISSGSTLAASTIYTQATSANNWTSSGSRTGNGTVTLTLSAGLYYAYISSTLNNQTVVSALVAFRMGAYNGSLLEHSPADIIRHFLIDLGKGSLPGDNLAWPIYTASEPDAGDDAITTYDTSGTTEGMIQLTGEVVQHAGVQVRIRAKTHPSGYAKADSVTKGLTEGTARSTVTIGSSVYQIDAITRTGTILTLGKDSPRTKRSLFTANFLVTVRQIV